MWRSRLVSRPPLPANPLRGDKPLRSVSPRQGLRLCQLLWSAAEFAGTQSARFTRVLRIGVSARMCLSEVSVCCWPVSDFMSLGTERWVRAAVSILCLSVSRSLPLRHSNFCSPKNLCGAGYHFVELSLG